MYHSMISSKAKKIAHCITSNANLIDPDMVLSVVTLIASIRGGFRGGGGQTPILPIS